ncbi:MAG: N-acetylmuramoyl-L-alanine amidase [Verrucomicrobia bacterium]|nr:N-acetylmuramoyl-L-alanine amidase [Verrucomicrobiota bacterium]
MRAQRKPGRRSWARRLAPWLGLGLLTWTVWHVLWFGIPERFGTTPGTPQRVLPGGFDTVILDPGHGGNDSGARARGLQEKVLVLDLAQRLSTELRSRGLTVVLTREDDHYLSLADRVRFARSVPDAIFISLHCNYAQEPGAHGFDVYRAETKTGESPTLVLTSAGPEPLALSEVQLARAITDSLGEGLGCDHHEAKTANFFVLRNLDMPALLIECGFLTSPEDARALGEPAFRTRLAMAIARGIVCYRASVAPAITEEEQTMVHRSEQGRDSL